MRMSRSPPADIRARLPFLDGWRAIAVLIVIMSHVNGFRLEPAYLKVLASWLPAGQIGVLIFFFISGFVITRSALAEIEATSTFSMRAFYIRRAFRIIPPLSLYLIACLFLGALGLVNFHLSNAVPAFLFVCNIEPFNRCLWLAGHTWSLAFEEQFYLLFPAVMTFVLLGRRPFIPHLIGALVFCLLPLIFPLSYSSRLAFVLVYGLFAAGVFAAVCEGALARRLRKVAPLGLAAAAAMVLVAPVTLQWGQVAFYFPLSFIVSIPLMVLCSGWTAWTSSVLANPVIRYVGRISYSIYLWQELATSELFNRQNLLVELAALASVVILSAALFEGVEKPLIRLGGRLSRLSPRWATA